MFLALLVFLGLACNGAATQYSRLWGKSGELWEPASRLPDFSFAGYHMGEEPIPKVPVKLNVKDFGAKFGETIQ